METHAEKADRQMRAHETGHGSVHYQGDEMSDTNELSTADIENTARRAAFTAGLRALADFLDAHPAVPCPWTDTMNVFVMTREELASIARIGRWEKRYSGDYFSLRREFGDDLAFEVNANRETVCRKVITGTRVVPAVEAQPEREEMIEEWVCDEGSLLWSER